MLIGARHIKSETTAAINARLNVSEEARGKASAEHDVLSADRNLCVA